MDPILGQIILWPGNFIPVGWALCDGTILQINQNQALYSLIGNTYGGTAGSTFALPDLRHRVPVGSPNKSEAGANEEIVNPQLRPIPPQTTIKVSHLPAHAHTASFTPGGGGASVNIAIPAVANPSAASLTDTPSNNVSPAKGADTGSGTIFSIYSSDPPGTTTLKPFTVSVPAGSGTVTVNNTGSGDALPILMPYLTLNYIIAVEGIYPPRP